jgi:hypothetical protein
VILDRFPSPQVTPLAQWMREATLFNALTRIKFFRTFLVQKAFEQWHRNVRFKLYCLTRQRLARRFFLAKQTFAPARRAPPSSAPTLCNAFAIFECGSCRIPEEATVPKESCICQCFPALKTEDANVFCRPGSPP